MGEEPSGLDYLFETYTLAHSPHSSKSGGGYENNVSHVNDDATKCNLNIDHDAI